MHLETLSSDELTVVLLSAALLLLFAFFFGKIFEKLHMPKVVGQITGGIVLSGTCLGHFFPGLIEQIFQAFPEEGKLLNVFYQLGLIFLMFASGLNTQLEISRHNTRLISMLSLGAIFVPFCVGLCIYEWFQPIFIGGLGNETAFMLVFLISMAVTSIPVISQIFFDLKLMDTKFSNIVLTVATIKDLFLWIFLNLAVSLATGAGKDLGSMLLTVVVTVLLFLVAHQVSRLQELTIPLSSASFCTLVYAFLFLMVTWLSYLHINIMYSAFITGYVVRFLAGTKQNYLAKVKNLSEVAFASFIPIYFALIGIQLNLIHEFEPVFFLLYFLIAFGLEFAGCYLPLMLVKVKPISRLNFAIVMNARGGPGIVLATVGYYYQIINVQFFTILILSTMLSSALAGFWLEYRKKHDARVFQEI